MHWKHSRYQILNVILANCHTFDEAYRVLRELEEDYVLSIDLALAESKRAYAKHKQSKTLIESEKRDDTNEFELIRAQADIMETEARKGVAQDCLNVARTTLAFIRRLIEFVNPRRTWKDVEDSEAHQLCQPLEWRLELTWKAYNMICATGTLSYDHFINIKMLPDNEKVTTLINELLEESRTTDRQTLLKYTKSDIFQRVVNENEVFIPAKLETLLGDNHVQLLRTESASDRSE